MWPQNTFDIETAKQRKDATTKFADKKNPIRVLVSSIPVAGQAFNFQEEEALILILLAHNTFDQVIAARTEVKQLPIIAGAARLVAEQHKVKQLMRDEEIPEKDWQLKYPSYKSQVIHEKAARIYRMLIGSRADHLKGLEGAMCSQLDQGSRRRECPDSMLAALKAGTIGTPIATTASVKKKVPFRVNLSARKAADSSPVSTPSTPTPGQAGVEAEKVVHRQLFLQSSPQTPELVPEPHIADAEVDMMDVVGDEPTQQAPIPKKRKRAEKEKTLPDPGPKRQRKEKEKPTLGTTKKRSLRS
ncbi:hypothetical protein AUEXF2481DRAFT_9693 [Aureobasidium subglaciale EXF-2481]|uniref:Uncharacterized protein n=1 Tax=Aureobasidium subglaciale (strain EXF-2481) TaxID=1043005 RepID=A0A074Y7G6_AURSE|nr:uncharacterized protein AUEXF2481DRAFT_9693 [Aureobasidium subglaciale EXF-2481]KEQ90147.1 hypothetical protein AUEXF2481DRAFT_9693 [Aureobasidium subglaciale EXF-2481]